MLSGQVPFQSSRSFRSADFIMQRITQGDIRFEGQQWESISPAAKDLIKGMLLYYGAIILTFMMLCCAHHDAVLCYVTLSRAAAKQTVL